MALSSNSIIHFTREKSALLGILKDYFKVSYCSEKIITKVDNLNFIIPMVSFCDIPLSEIKDHIDKYGSYGIGLTKEWASKNGLNPVIYVDKSSTIGANYSLLYNSLIKGKTLYSATKNDLNIIEILRYMKNYEADLKTKNIDIQNYRFADEKEWRFVPDFNEAHGIIRADFYNELMKESSEDSVKDLRLEFNPEDIKYIIIKDENEISEFIDFLRKTMGSNYSYDQVERLVTRIITSDQIKLDF